MKIQEDWISCVTDKMAMVVTNIEESKHAQQVEGKAAEEAGAVSGGHSGRRWTLLRWGMTAWAML